MGGDTHSSKKIPLKLSKNDSAELCVAKPIRQMSVMKICFLICIS